MIRTLWLILPLALAVRAQTGMVLQLTMKHAVELALTEEGSAKMQLAREFVVQAQSRSTQARSALLPNLDLTAGAQNLTRNLAALGLTTSTLGFPVPSRVGPLNVSDARAGVGQAVFDLGSVYRYRASKAEVTGTQSDADSVAEQVAADVAQAYLVVLRSGARVEAVSANLELAKSVRSAAENHRRAGNGTGLEVTRASLRVADEQQKLLQAQVEKRSAERLLLRATGLRLDVTLMLTDRLEQPAEVPPAADAFSAALRSRPDWKAQGARVLRAGLAVQSARAESLPSVRAFADYGATGSGPWKALATYTAGVSVQFSVYDGGRRRSRAVEAASQERQEKARASDLRQQIEYEIEAASDQLHSINEQLAVTEMALTTAQQTLEQVERRYEEGVVDHVTVAEAQADLARARDSKIAALYASNVAWVDFHRAAGRLRTEIASH